LKNIIVKPHSDDKKRNLLFLTINSFSIIPLNRFLVNYLKGKFNLSLIESYIQNTYKFDNIDYKEIKSYTNTSTFNNQNIKDKIYKYYFITAKLLKNIGKSEYVLYVQDYSVLIICSLIKKLFFKHNWKIVYHQYEMELLDKMSFYKKIISPDLLIFPEINRAKYFQSFFLKFSQSQLMIFPNTCLISKKTDKDNFCLFQKIKGRITIGHIGNIGTDHYLNLLLALIEELNPKKYFFIIIGKQSYKVKELLTKYSEKENVYLTEEIPHNELKYIYPFINFGIVLYKPIDLNFTFCAPNKLYEYWSYGIPVIAHKLPGLIPLFNNKIQGMLFDFEDTKTTLDNIKDYLEEKTERDSLQSYFANNFSLNSYLELLLSKINSF